MTSLLRAGLALRWYLRTATGESKWDDYLLRCRDSGDEPMSRRAFERRRAELKEATAQSRCC